MAGVISRRMAWAKFGFLGAAVGTERAIKFWRNVVLAGFVAALIAGVFLPVYTDEIGWRFQERAGFDGVDKMFSEVCGPNTLARPPFFMMPVRYFSSTLNALFADPFYVRLSGILYALLWTALVLALLKRIVPDAVRRASLGALCFGLLALGTMPLLLVWSRPEQPVILAVAAALLLAFDRDGDRSGSGRVRLRVALMLALSVVAVSYHVKGLLLLPLFLCCLPLTGEGRQARIAQAAVGALMIVMTASAAHYWVQRLQCPADPALHAEYARNNMGLEITGSGLFGVLDALGSLIGNATLIDYFGMPAPRERPLSAWLLPYQISEATSFRWFIGLVIAWLVALSSAIVALVTPIRQAFAQRTFDPRAIIAIVLLGTVLVWSATQSIRNVYEAGFVLPLVMLAILFANSAGGDLSTRALAPLAVIFGAGGLLSIGAVASIYGPSLMQGSRQQGYLAGQPNSVAVFGYGSIRPEIEQTARLCALPPPNAARAVLIDELTYFAYMRSLLPQHRLGVVGLWKGAITDPVAYLKSRGSDGAILGCHFLPDTLKSRAKRNGEFCCLAPPNW